jgi:regulator of sigma E protease
MTIQKPMNIIQSLKNNYSAILKAAVALVIIGYFAITRPHGTLSVVIFILLLGVLVFVHELGHFAVAKLFGIRVDEFGMGFPPRAKKLFTRNGTDYTLNWIPFGGFVKIYGEDSLQDGKNDPDYKRSMGAKSWWKQILVLIAGVTMNILLAWALFSFAFMIGAPTAVSGVDRPERVQNPQLTVLQVMPGSPAEKSGLAAGDKIVKLETLDTVITGTELSSDNFTAAIRATELNIPVHLQVQKIDKTTADLLIIPQRNLIGDYPAIGVSVDQVGMYREGFFRSIKSGFVNTLSVTKQTGAAFWNLIHDAVLGKADTKNLTGPVGLVSVVGDAQKVGAVYVIMLTAMISINLAVLNVIPFPALDGGRVVIVIIEAVTRRKINANIVGWVNTIGFFLLIALMIFISVKDVIKLF